MARKVTITMSDILDTGFMMAREEGFLNVTARKVALKAGCSTQPIFRIYKNMDELWDAIYEKAIDFFQEYYEKYPRESEVPFVNLGMAYISFASEEKHLFELLFVHEKRLGKSLFELLNGTHGNLTREIHLASNKGCVSEEELFMRMWIFIHGAACMSLSGEYDLSLKDTLKLLEESFESFARNNGKV